MQVFGLPNPFDRRDLVPFVHHRERQAAVHAPPVHVHRAGAALPVVAALLRARQVDPLPQRIQQRGPRIQPAQHIVLPVHAQRQIHGSGASLARLLCRGNRLRRRVHQRSRPRQQPGCSKSRQERTPAESSLLRRQRLQVDRLPLGRCRHLGRSRPLGRNIHRRTRSAQMFEPHLRGICHRNLLALPKARQGPAGAGE